MMQTAPEVSVEPMDKIERLVEALQETGIRWCHWKSNLALADSLAGQSDIDLLIHREDAAEFRLVLTGLGFRPAADRESPAFPSIEHYFALDEGSGVLVHVHAYYRVISGDSLVKNYRLPIEGLLLENTRMQGAIRVPLKSVELIVFTLRIMLKHTSLVELLLVGRYWKQVRREIAWLREDGSLDETLAYLRAWLPPVDERLFAECIAAAGGPRLAAAPRAVGHAPAPRSSRVTPAIPAHASSGSRCASSPTWPTAA